MPQFTNTTRGTLAFPKKGGGTVDIRAGESGTGLDEDHAQVKGALLSSALVKGKITAESAAVVTSADSSRARGAKAE